MMVRMLETRDDLTAFFKCLRGRHREDQNLLSFQNAGHGIMDLIYKKTDSNLTLGKLHNS